MLNMRMVQINNVLVFQVMGLDETGEHNHEIHQKEYSLTITNERDTGFVCQEHITINPEDNLGHAYCMEYEDKQEATKAANAFGDLVNAINDIPDLDISVIM